MALKDESKVLKNAKSQRPLSLVCPANSNRKENGGPANKGQLSKTDFFWKGGGTSTLDLDEGPLVCLCVYIYGCSDFDLIHKMDNINTQNG